MATDAVNTYLNTPCCEKLWRYSGMEPSQYKIRKLTIAWSLYVLNSSDGNYNLCNNSTVTGDGISCRYFQAEGGQFK